jgi:hypothetical protein
MQDHHNKQQWNSMLVGFAASLCALIKGTAWYLAESAVRLGDAEDDPVNVSFSYIGDVHDTLVGLFVVSILIG